MEENKRTSLSGTDAAPALVSIGIFARNEETVIERALESLLSQSLFEELASRGQAAEVICVTNGCTDGTAEVARRVFARASRPNVAARVAEIREAGKFNAWNQFTHSLSARGARYLFMMDADIAIHRAQTLWSMYRALEEHPEAHVAVDRPRKQHEGVSGKLGARLAKGAAAMTQAAPAQLCGQLYGIRAEVARRIYIPRDLAACEDGYIKALVCTDFGTHPPQPERIRLAPGAEHTFEAYERPLQVLRNQKRQVIGQTIVHILVDQWLPEVPREERPGMAGLLRSQDASDPDWLKRRIDRHLAQVRVPWRLYPGLAGLRFRRLAHLPKARWLACLPAAVAGTATTCAASLLAWRYLRRGSIHYWPEVRGSRMKSELPKETPV